MIRFIRAWVVAHLSAWLWIFLGSKVKESLVLTDRRVAILLERMEVLERRYREHHAVMGNIRAAGDGGFRGHNWMLVCFKRGNDTITHVYDFGNHNMIALLDMAKRFEKAGMCVTVDLPPTVRFQQ